MAIYSINHGELSYAYGADSVDLLYAYDINASIVFRKEYTPTVDYSNYSYVEQFSDRSTSDPHTQGFAIYNDKIFWVAKSGNSVDYPQSTCYVWDMNGNQALDQASIALYAGHGNNLCFSDKFAEEGDIYPTLLISTAYTNPSYINRIDNDYNVTLLQKLYIPPIENISSIGYDICYGETTKVAYTASALGNNDDPTLGTRIGMAKWDLTRLTDNGDGTFTPALIRGFSTDWHYWKQGIKYHDGLLWFVSGYPNYQAYIYGFDPITGETKYTIDCETKVEIEGAYWYPDSEAEGGYALYVGFRGFKMRKYTFGAL